MFRALLCPSSGARDYNVDYQIGRFVLGLQPGHYSSLTAPNLQPTANQERNNQCGNQHYSRELLMMGIVVPETCWTCKMHNKTMSDIYLAFHSSVITMMHGRTNFKYCALCLILREASDILMRPIPNGNLLVMKFWSLILFRATLVVVKSMLSLILSLCLPGEVIVVRPMYSSFYCACKLTVETILKLWLYHSLVARRAHSDVGGQHCTINSNCINLYYRYSY